MLKSFGNYLNLKCLFLGRIMEGEVSELDGNIFYTFISNWVICGVVSDIESADNSLHRLLSQEIQLNVYFLGLSCVYENDPS